MRNKLRPACPNRHRIPCQRPYRCFQNECKTNQKSDTPDPNTYGLTHIFKAWSSTKVVSTIQIDLFKRLLFSAFSPQYSKWHEELILNAPY